MLKKILYYFIAIIIVALCIGVYVLFILHRLYGINLINHLK